MSASPLRKPLGQFIAATLFTLVLLSVGCGGPETPEVGSRTKHGTLIRAVKSDFSNIRVREQGTLRSLFFVEPSGLEVRQTSMDLDHPGRLVVPYTRTMFSSFLFKYPQERVLIVGLGGGSMVRFLNHHFPRTRIDAVEIDPVIVGMADELFDTRPGPRTQIFTEDAIRFLQRDGEKYDAIYMDAFLEPGADTDPRGIPKHLKTVDFLRGLQRRLNPGGVVAFNLVEHPGLSRDLQTIAAAFPAVYVFRVPGTKNLSVIATPTAARHAPDALRAKGRQLDRSLEVGMSFENMVNLLETRR